MCRKILFSVSCLLLFAFSACATVPTGPSVNVLPSQGKPFDLFRTEDETCRQWAEQKIGISAQQTYDKNLATGAVAGTAIGAGLGAVVGSASGHAGPGALIGAAGGLLLGSAGGSDSGRYYGREAQRRYDNAYIQCMYSYGNQIPGYRRRTAAPRPVTPPPPVMARADTPPPDALPAPSDTPPPPPDLLPEPGQFQPPPELSIEEAPQFIYSPELRMYVAVGVPYDLVYTGSDYFYFYGGRWYRGPYYDGPWVVATRRYFPPVLLRYRIDRIRYYRNFEYRRYERNRSHYDGRFHRPEYRGERRKAGHREEHH